MLKPERNLKVIFQALSRALRYHKINEREIRVVFAGVFDHPGSTENRRLVHDLGLDNVVVELGYLPRNRVLEELQAADALLLIGDQEERAKQYIPSRLYEYLYVRRPILAVLRDGEAADVIAQLGAGVVFKANDIQGITNQLVSWVRQKRKGHWPLTLPPTDSHRFAPFTRLGQASELAGMLDMLFPEEKNGRMTGNL